MERCYSPVPSMGAFRDSEDSPQGFSSDSTAIEQRDGGGGSDGRAIREGIRKDEKKERTGVCGGAKAGVGSGSSLPHSSCSSSATDVEADDEKVKAGGACMVDDDAVAVKPCGEIVIEKAVEHVGGLPCRACCPDFPMPA